MRVLVCGSRTWTNTKRIAERLCVLPRGSTVIHGGARGADQRAGSIAETLGYRVEVFMADWKKYGRAAGLVRNNDMLATNPDLVIAFWDGTSTGTQHTIDGARKRGIPIEVIAL